MAKYCSECGMRLGSSGRAASSIKTTRPGPKKRTRAASAYNKRYSKAFKKVAPKYKTKAGAWRKNGYRSAVRAAHKLAKK